jgi:lipopolysaccharide transport system ATP-binding protein
MSEPVISINKIGKRFRIGERERYLALRDVLTRAIIAPFRRTRERRSIDYLWALRDVSFDVHAGEVIGLIGNNGAGKTTLLKLLSRITRPTSGYAEIRGRVGSLLEVGTGFHPELTGKENTYLSGAILGMTKRDITKKFEEIVSFAEVERFLDTPLKHYSTGMQTRLAFAVAAHLEPEILFVDEVLAVGDAAFQKKCLGKMGEVSRQGRTIVFVSHNMTALRSLCSRAIWLEGGHVTETGEAGNVIDHYLQKLVATNLESTWQDVHTAPGDHRVRLRSVRVIPLGDSNDQITVQTPLRMEFTYWNYTPGAVLNIAIFLNNLEGMCIFNISSDFGPRPAGLIRHTVEIPGELLNTGSYSIDLLVVKDASVGMFRQNNVVAFEVLEGKVVGNWYGRVPGAVRPRLKWVSEALGESDLVASTGTVTT